MKRPKLYGPAPVSRLCLAGDDTGTAYDSGRDRCEVILDADGNALTWRPWTWNGTDWKPGTWRSPTADMRDTAEAGGAA